MTSDGARLLIAGIGNIFLGDDGFGVEVVRRLRDQALPPGVKVADYGIRGMHLAFELTGGSYETVILIDAVGRGEKPGTLFLLEPTDDDLVPRAPADAHAMTPQAVLGMLDTLGGFDGRILLLGCEPEDIDERMGLTETVQAAVDEAVVMVREVVASHTAAGSDRITKKEAVR